MNAKTKSSFDLFGFLKYPTKIEFDGGKVSIEDNYEYGCRWIEKYMHKDGFIYPLISHKVELNSISGEVRREIPKTERPALLHKLPSSHKLIVENTIDYTFSRMNDAGFIIHLLSYVFGTRLQFEGWWFDRRVPIKPTNDFYIAHSTIEDFLSKGYQRWKSWDEEKRKKIINILIMYSRAPSYDWDWERFTIEYMVFDGLYNLTYKLYHCRANNHKERFKTVCDKFGIQFHEELVNRIYALRNDLFHETLWDKGQPCTANTGSDAFYQPLNLRRFNSRLIPAILGYKTPYVKIGWWYMGKCVFDRANT